MDYPSAKALAEAVVSVAPFGKVSEAHLMQAKKWIDACDHVIAALDLSTAGEMAMCFKTLCDYAKEQGKI